MSDVQQTHEEGGFGWFTAWYEYLMCEEDYTPEAAERQAHAYCVQGRKPPTLEADDENAAPDAVGAVSEVTAIAAEALALAKPLPRRIATAFTDEGDEIPF